MLNIYNDTDTQSVSIPKRQAVAATAALKLTLTSTIDRAVEYTSTPAVSEASQFYFIFPVQFSATIPSGEYEYTLRADGCVVATGLARVGDYKVERTTLDVDVRYKQYGE